MAASTAQGILATLKNSYGEQMLCPMTGLVIPKRLDLNLAWRKRTVAACENNDVMRKQVYSACSQSILYWINLCVMTYRPKKVNPDGKEIALTGSDTNVPFVTWPVQDEVIRELVGAIKTGRDIAIDKARDMGATWLCLMVFLWFWLFKGGTTFLLLSRKESLVDRRGSMDSLFEKLRYAIKWLPNWMQPNMRDTYMHLENKDNGSVIDGESTNESAGQASRSTATLLDEFARVPNGEAIDVATADTTACRIFNSTPGSPTSHYTKLIRSKRCKIIPLPWWRHPEKGRGLYLLEGEDATHPETGERVKVLGKGANLPKPPGKEAGKWVSPWYVIENHRRKSLRNIAQNLDMEHGRVGDMVFDPEVIEKHRAAFARDPDQIGTLRYPLDISDKVKKQNLRRLYRVNDESAKSGLRDIYFSTVGGTTPLRLWTPLIEYEIPGTADPNTKERVKVMRPNQDDRYVFGVDISGGTGASNSIISVKSHRTGQIIAKFWDAHTTPEALADFCLHLAVWVGGRKLPYIVFEKNGPGMQFGRKLIDFGYPSLYFQSDDTKKGKVKTKRWGWHSSNQRKELLVGEYRDALASGKIINPCNEALDEALDYVFDDMARVTPGSMGQDESSRATATHGDHVIADALTVLGSADLPADIPDEPVKEPFGSFAYRRRLARRADAERKAWEE